MLNNWLILDVASAPVADAASYLEGSVKPPANYKDPEKIAEFIREKEAERLSMAATDIDLARVTGIASMDGVGRSPDVFRTENEEAHALDQLGNMLLSDQRTRIITYGGFNFDLPLLMRRARYLGVNFPAINLDRYKSPHVDLCEVLSDRNPSRRRPLTFYVKRLGWTDLTKTLSGAEEARVPETGQWAELEDSLRHDMTATYRLAQWLGLIQPVKEMAPEQVEVGF